MASPKPKPSALPPVVVKVVFREPTPSARAAWSALWRKLLQIEKVPAPGGDDRDSGEGLDGGQPPRTG